MRRGRYRILIAGAVLLMLTGCGAKGTKQNEAGLELYREGRYAEAITEFEEAIVENNKESQYYDNMGMAYLELGDYASAGSAFQMALNLSEKDKAAYRGMGILYLREGRYEEAIAALATAVEMAGNKIGEAEYDCLLYKAEAELGKGDYAGAIGTYGILVDSEPKNADYRYLRGRAYLMQGSLENALDEFDAGTANAPKNYEYYINIYALLSERGYEAEGREYLQDALTIGGDSDEVHLYRGRIQYLLENYSSAAAEFNAAKSGMESQDLIRLGLCYSRMGDSESAYNTYMKAVDQEPENAALYEQLGLMKMEDGDYRMAISFFEKGIAQNDPDLQWNLKYCEAICYENLYEFDTALEKFETLNAEFGERQEVTHEIEFLRTR